MTFDEALDQLEPRTIWSSEMRDLLDQLRKEYAPTVEMTKTQYNFIATDYEQEDIVDAVANLSVDDILREKFHASFWYPLTQREVVQAWLHPETIKIVGD